MMRARAFASALCALSLACGAATDGDLLAPTGQVLLYFDTDATLPPAPGESEDPRASQASMFDRMRVEFFAPNEQTPCTGCSREFALDRRTVAAGRSSVGFVPRANVSGYRVRLQLFRIAGPEAAQPRPRSTIEVVAALPVVGAEGVVEATAFLATDDVGHPRGTLDAPEALESARPTKARVGTWIAARSKDCEGAAGPEEVCVHGGAYWLGNPVREAESERLVVLSPFFIDKTEVTVAAYRASKLAKLDVPANPIAKSNDNPLCTFSTSPGPQDDFPVNCIDAEYSEKYCAAQGKRLPTETEFEVVSGALHGLRYPWGTDYPTCEDAMWGRADDTSLPTEIRPCVKGGIGAAKVGSGVRDRVALGGGEVVDLAANVGEWTRDIFAPWGKRCWEDAGIATDPVCAGVGKRTIRGGEWGSIPFALVSTIRVGAPPDERSTRTGFRCVREQ